MEVRLKATQTDEKTLKSLQEILLRYSGRNPVYLRVVEANGDYLLRSRELFADPCDSLLRELRELLGEKEVGLSYHPRQAQQAASAPGSGMQALLNGNRHGNASRSINSGPKGQ